MGAFDDALEHHREALMIREAVGEKQGIVMSLQDLGLLHIERGELDEARERLDEAVVLGLQLENDTADVTNLLALARLERELGAFGTAAERAREAITLAEAMSAKEQLRRGDQELATIEEQAGRFAAALRAYKTYREVSEEIFDAERARRFDLLERRFQAERREREIESLKSEPAIQALELSRHRMQRNVLFLAILVLGATGVSIYRRRAADAKRAEELSVTDVLTGLRNRRYLLQTMEEDVARSSRKYRAAAEADETPREADLVFLLVDLDQFKSVNDSRGHAAGDCVLVEVAELLRETCRAGDTVVRWGGEEFLVVHRFMDRRDTGALAERIRTTVESHVFRRLEGDGIRITCSIGCAALPFYPAKTDALDWEQVVRIAEEALYAAKRAGRNAWVNLSPAEDAPAPAPSPRVATSAPEDVGDRRRRLRMETSRGDASLVWSEPSWS